MLDERISKSQSQQQEEGDPERKQQQVAETSALDRVPHVLLEEHERAERPYVRLVPAQQVEIHG
jgi:hypothetical protein